MVIIYLLLVIALAVISTTITAVFAALPYVTGLITGFVLTIVFPALKNIVPGESGLSTFMLILAIEIIIGVLVHIPQTSGPMVVFTSMLFIGVGMVIASSGIEYASWQKAVAVTIIYLLAAAAILVSNYACMGHTRFEARNVVASVFVAILYAGIIGINMIVILGYIWDGYVKANFSAGTYKTFDNATMVVYAIAMLVAAVVSFLRDRYLAANDI